ncbi:MAG: hypothetical protein JWN77_2424 [Frankiales bacterium]|jgi:uncharacterized protein YecE (DUF72 family)|nr:hypothetical protein [Frankiales bacterium]
MPVLIGTSGWQYAHWKRVFYPRTVPQRVWLEHHSALFQTVEVNNAFYRLPERRVFEQWAIRTPADYVITVKASRYLTHMKRLIEPQEPVQRLMERVAGLGAKLGSVLVQLPPTLKAEPGRLDETLEHFPKGTRVAVEPRHESWWTPDVETVLRDRGAALVWADRWSRPIAPLWRTTDWGYLRLHMGGGEPSIWPYEESVLAEWADRICATYSDDEDVYVYTNNDPEAAALRDAVTLGRLLRERGRTVTRLPEMEQVTLEPYEVWTG